MTSSIASKSESATNNESRAIFANDYCLVNLQTRPALEIWTAKDTERLWMHLHNDNGPFNFVMGFRDRRTGEKRYVRSKQLPVDRAISWSLATLQGGKVPEKSLAFVPYSTNADGMSRWGGFDFDAHNGQFERARQFAFGAFRRLLNTDFATILESSGSGGWHVWAIARGFKPAAGWIQLLKTIARDIGAPLQSGICEIFPPDTLSRGFGKGLRAPGGWNPATGTVSEILWQNADDLLKQLPLCVSRKLRRIGEPLTSYSATSPIEKDITLSLTPAFDAIVQGLDYSRICQPATRHQLLAKMVGTIFHQVSSTIAAQMAGAQFLEKTVVTNADEQEHMLDFENLWAGMEKQWLIGLGESEREKLDELETDAEHAAFRIIRNFASKARCDGRTDFPIARDNLGMRLGITGRGAGGLRKKFVRLEITAQTACYRANVSAARYRWLLSA